MKRIAVFIFLFFIGNTCFSQHKCKPGFRCIPSMSSSSHIIKGGCYRDSVAKRILNTYWEGVCYDTQVFMMFVRDSSYIVYRDTHTWNDSIGCTSKETWTIQKGDKSTEITKKQYDSLSLIK